jgi:hypothetical protein
MMEMQMSFYQPMANGALSWVFSALIPEGSTANQTLYWDGDSWEVSSFLSNDGTTVTIGSDGTDGQLSIFSEQGGTDYSVIFQPNPAMTETTTYILPPDNGDNGEVLITDGSGGLTWGTLDDNDWLVTGNNMTSVPTGNVGIGTTGAPSQKLEIEDGNLLLSNTGLASEFRLAEPSAGGSNYTAFKAQAQSGNLTYTLPDDYPATTGFLQSDNTGALDWIYSAVVDPGTANNQTLYWDGDSWAPSSYLSNDGTTVTIGSNGTDGQLSIFSEQGVTDYSLIFQPNPLMTETTTYTFPPAYGNAGQVLTTDASGNLSWGDAPDDGDWLVAGNNMTSIPPGNVGIGVAGVPTDKLDVDNGNIRLSNTTGTAQLIMETAAGANTTAFQTVAQPLGNIVYSLPPSLPLAGQTGYLLSDENGILSWQSVSTIPAGTSSNQTLRWDGSDWVTSDFMTNNDSQVQIGDDGEGDGVLVLYNDQVGTDYNVTFQPNPAMTESTTYTLPDSYGSAGQVLTTDASGNLSWDDAPADNDWVVSGSDMWSNTNITNVGIGTTSPGVLLDVNGAASFSNTVTVGYSASGPSPLVFNNSDGDITSFSVSATQDDPAINYVWPAEQAHSGSVSYMSNDGDGNLFWSDNFAFSGDIRYNTTVVSATDEHYATADDVIILFTQDTDVDLYLPDTSSGDFKGKIYYIRWNFDPGASAAWECTLHPFGNSQVDDQGADGDDLTVPRSSGSTRGVLLVCDGTDWFIITSFELDKY